MRYKISTLLLLTATVSFALGWYLGHSRQVSRIDTLELRMDTLESRYAINQICDKLMTRLNADGFHTKTGERSQPTSESAWISFWVRASKDPASEANPQTVESCIRAVKSNFRLVNERHSDKYALTIPSVVSSGHLDFLVREK